MSSRTGYIFSLILISLLGGFLALRFLSFYPVISDSQWYDQVAANLLVHYRFVPADGIIWPPGYPAFLASVYALFGHNYQAVYLVQFLLLGVLGALIFLIARRFLNLPRWLAFLGGLAVITWFYFVMHALLLMSEIVYSALLLAGIYFALEFAKNPSYKNSAWLAFFLGLATLTRSVALLLLVWLIIFFVVFSKRFALKKEDWKKGALAIVIFCAVLTPWTIFQYKQTGSFVPVSSNLAPVLEKANKTLGYLEPEQKTPREIGFGELAAAKAKNIYLFWDPGAKGYQAEAVSQKFAWAWLGFAAYKIEFYLALILAAAALFVRKKEIWLLWAAVFYFWGVHTALYPFPRYTLPVIPVVIILALAGFNFIKEKLWQTN